jgi:succinoglycan biosynthesis transport protein ExoP
MPGGRAELPVLAELSAPAGTEAIWSLRRSDLERLGGFRQWLDGRASVLVTGAGQLTGALAVTLAGVAAASGLRVILLEGELARPRLATELGLAPTPGLHEYLRWEASPAEVLQPLTLTGAAAGAALHPLVCIVAGRPAADPAVLAGLQSFRHMTAKLRSAYELVVIAGPGLDASGAGLGEIAAQAEGVIAAIGPQSSSRRRLRALGGTLGRLGTQPLGAVVVGGAG